jgi:hypothetical protein
MTPATPKTSSRLVRAAAAERADLEQHRDRLFKRREELRAELDRIERGLIETEERLALLGRLSPPDSAPLSNGNGNGQVRAAEQTGSPNLRILKGTAIRETAVRALAERPDGSRPIHYRRWHELLEEAGYAVGGKDPAATFLTQVSRSPVVRKTMQPGMYELDYETPERLRRRLAELQSELRAGAISSAHGKDLAEGRRRREETTTQISQVERNLEEALRVFSPEGEAGAA